MTDELQTVLDECWEARSDPEDLSAKRICRYCMKSEELGHADGCPCAALSLALQQRDAIAEFTHCEKRSLTMQGAYRLAKKSDKVNVKRRLDDAMLRMEAARARLMELGIDFMIR